MTDPYKPVDPKPRQPEPDMSAVEPMTEDTSELDDAVREVKATSRKRKSTTRKTNTRKTTTRKSDKT